MQATSALPLRPPTAARLLAASLALCLGLAVLAPRAFAAEQPVLAPTRDVSVIYRVTPNNQAVKAERMKLSFADHDQRVRMDFYSQLTNDPIGAIIYDQPANRVLTLVPNRKVYYQVPAQGRANPGLLLNKSMHYVRTGATKVAGLDCTEWQVTHGDDYQGTACVTGDGVVLRATRSKPAPETIEALSVTYGTPPAALFEPGPGLTLAPSK